MTSATAQWRTTAAPVAGWTRDSVATRFTRFAAHRCGDGYAPLYQRLASAAATDPLVLDLAAHAQTGHSPPDLLFAAVHALLLTDAADDPLAGYYPTCTSQPDRGEPWPAFQRFCRTHADTIAATVARRLVQTNEPRRCTYLWPALSLIAGMTDRPLALLDVGASAGLNLHCDQYGYNYDDTRRGDPYSRLQLHATLTAGRDLPDTDVRLGWRGGLDLHPLDITDASDVAWLRALVWADHPQRLQRLETAVGIAQHDPVAVHRGDARSDLADAADRVSADHQLVVWHTAVAAHMTAPDRDLLRDQVLAVGSTRPLLWLQAEPRAPGLPRLLLTAVAGPHVAETPLGDYHPHGEWLAWELAADAAQALRSVVRSMP